MTTRSVLDTLDLCTSLAAYSDLPPSTQGIGWLSPRISFSTGIVDETPKREVERIGSCGREAVDGTLKREVEMSCEKEDDRSGDERALDFEFCMGSSSLDPVSSGCMLPADELFHKGRLLPQSLPPFHPRQDKVFVGFSGPLDTHKTPFVSVGLPSQSQYVSGARKSGPSEVDFSGPLYKPEKIHSRFSGPLGMRPASPSRFSGPLSVGNVTSSAAVPAEGTGKPKSQTWEKVIGLLRRARSDSHRDRFCSVKEQALPCSKQCTPTSKNSVSAGSSLRLIFRRNSSIDKTAEAIPSETCSLPVKSSATNHPTSDPVAAWSPPHPAAFFPVSVQASSSKHAGLAALRVASPVYSTSLASETGRDELSDMWSSSATNVDLRPGSVRDLWRMHETESSLEITFDKYDKLNAADVKKKADRSSGAVSAATNPPRIVLKNLERCSNLPSKGGKGQDQLRALRTREIRRSPDRFISYTSNVRVTPVLNVPVCIAPTMRSSKAAKGRLASLRSLLSFKKEKDEQAFSDPAMAA